MFDHVDSGFQGQPHSRPADAVRGHRYADTMGLIHRRLDLLAGVKMEDLPGAAQGARDVDLDQIGAGLQIFAHGVADLLDPAKGVSHKSMAVWCTDAPGGDQ